MKCNGVLRLMPWRTFCAKIHRVKVHLLFSFLFAVNRQFFSPAQLRLVKGFAVSDLVDKPWPQVFSNIRRYRPSFVSRIGFSVPVFQLYTLVEFHRILPTHALALSVRQIFKRKNPYEHE